MLAKARTPWLHLEWSPWSLLKPVLAANKQPSLSCTFCLPSGPSGRVARRPSCSRMFGYADRQPRAPAVPLIHWQENSSSSSCRARPFQCESHEFFCVFLNFRPCRGDLVHVLFVAEKRRLGNPDGFPRRTMGDWILRLQKIVCCRRLCARKPPAVLAVLKHIERMHWRIAGLIRDPLGVHGRDQLFGADTRKLLRIDVEDVRVVAIAGTTRVEFLRCDSRDLREQPVEQTRVLMAPLRLAVQSRELGT